MVTVIIFNSGVVATKKTNMPCCGTCLDLALISFSGLIQPYICDDVRNAITYERPLPAGCIFTRERSERVVSASAASIKPRGACDEWQCSTEELIQARA